MLTDNQWWKLLSEMSNFYQDHLPIDSEYAKLLKIYSRMVDHVWTRVSEVKDAQYPDSAPTLSTIPYVRIDISDAIYSIADARVLRRMDNFEDQIEQLDEWGRYAPITFSSTDNAGTPIIYNMRLYDAFDGDDMLGVYLDYFVVNNKLYLLPDFIEERERVTYALHAYDVKYNDHTLEKNFGTLHTMTAGPLLPRYEYRDALEAFTKLLRSQLGIRDIKEAIQFATKWNYFDVQDAFSPTITPQKKALYDRWDISPLRFLLILPESKIKDKMRLNMLSDMLFEVKNMETDFMFFFEILRQENIELPEAARPSIDYQRTDWMDFEHDDIEGFEVASQSLRFTEEMLDNAGRYDSVFRYDWNLRYDDPPGNEVLGYEQQYEREETYDRAMDLARVTHVTTIIPREYRAVASGESIYLEHRSTDTNVDHFELAASLNEKTGYEVIDTMANDSSLTRQQYNYDANSDNYRYYKVRSVTPDGDVSLWSLSIDLGDEFATETIAVTDDSQTIDDTSTTDDTTTMNDETTTPEDFYQAMLGADYTYREYYAEGG